ncbi:17938_t:CDS:2 [Entrophospora sp. SA101]|nr:1008_t:CDS:2 [Entrophospora sp. SA101]CAJ0762594.1 17938_t:CDS:2 [Entrophospora sp. SA101]CAJ0830594.1 2707_t:CDS:2 [Entrophospora sp. SA101]
MPKSFFRYPELDHATAGITAGAVTTISLHPFDLIKTRFQVDDSARKIFQRHQFGATFKTMNIIWRKYGLKGLYRGVSPNFTGATTSWGLYFYWYDLFKQKTASNNKSSELSPIQHLVASAEAGAITALFTNPFWVIKTRMCATNIDDPRAYKGLFDGLYQILKYEGIRGLYRGIIPAFFGVSHGALQFMAYEEMKKWKLKIGSKEDRKKLDNLEYLLIAGSSKIFATISTYPYQLIKARLQNQSFEVKYNGVIDTIKKVFRSEGFFGFYKGLAPNILRVLPGTCTTFLVYENMMEFFRNHANDH